MHSKWTVERANAVIPVGAVLEFLAIFGSVSMSVQTTQQVVGEKHIEFESPFCSSFGYDYNGHCGPLLNQQRAVVTKVMVVDW